ncbi:MAG TPA: M1 family peptidase [Planctomycetes bacterium]|nr:M1 family peptidase [Planctomycetota bacterium]HIL38390.1 M1 family peptidase [Planctomycetota bacterium]
MRFMFFLSCGLLMGVLGSGTAQASSCLEPQEAIRPVPDNRSSESHYVIHAKLLEAQPGDVLAKDGDHGVRRRLEGRLTLSWTNRSADTVSDLWFHLHHNAFSNNRSVHLTEANGMVKGSNMERDWGWQQVNSISVSGRELLSSMTFEHPDGPESEDRTVFSVDLPAPVEPGETVRVDLEWTSLIPRVRRRSGTHDDFIMMSHWFPKLGVYEGGRGWNCHQFHMNTEFYADFGTYDVTLDLPSRYKSSEGEVKVGASGVAVGGTREEGGRLELHYLAPSKEDRQRTDAYATLAMAPTPRVHGFAWVADPDFVVHTETFRFEDWSKEYSEEVKQAVIANPNWDAEEDVTLRDVVIRVLLQPEHADQGARHARATAAALFFYGLWWGEYPYSQITVVDPAHGASAVGGMEYPTLFTCGTSMFTDEQMYRPESVTVHEAGHQFWYGLVGNNEYEAAWLDEGFNSYTDSEVLSLVYGDQRASSRYSSLPVWGTRPGRLPAGGHFGDIVLGRHWKLPGKLPGLKPLGSSAFVDWWRDQPDLTFIEQYSNPMEGDRQGYLRDPATDPIETVAFRYCNRGSYRANSYPRTAVALRTLRGLVGRTMFLRGMRHFSQDWRYRHPYPNDFYESFMEGSGTDVGWFFEEVFQGTGTVDWAVTVAQHETGSPDGFFMQADGSFKAAAKEIKTPQDAKAGGEGQEGGTAESQAPKSPGYVPTPGGQLHYDVVVRRKGSVRLPLQIQVALDSPSKDVDRTILKFEWTREMQAESAWWRLPLEPGERTIHSVIIDPERKYHIDMDLSNNRWYAKKDRLAPWRWTERSITWHSRILQWLSRIAG